MDLSALESAVKALETSLDAFEWWITVSTILVVLGLVIEYWFPLRELVEALKHRPPFPWKLIMEMVGGILVTLGVAGELWFQSRASNVQTFIRSDTHKIEAILNKEAGDARKDAGKAIERASTADERASTNEKEAAQLRKDAAGLKKEAEDERLARVRLQELVIRRGPRSFVIESAQDL